MPTVASSHRHRFPAEIISHSFVVLSFCAQLSGVEELLAMRGVTSLTKPSENGASSLVSTIPTICDEDLCGLAIAGNLMKCS
jgi:hypothetical protein